MKELLKCQSVLRSEFDRFIANFKKANKTVKASKGYLQGRLDGLKEHWLKIEENNCRIMEIRTEEDKHDKYFTDEVFSQLEESYYATAGAISDLLEEIVKEKEPKVSFADKEPEKGKCCNTTTSSGDLKLPRIALTKFYGDYNSWTSFHDMFDSLIIKNKLLSPVQKRHYLKTNLGGEAEQLLRHFQIT